MCSWRRKTQVPIAACPTTVPSQSAVFGKRERAERSRAGKQASSFSQCFFKSSPNRVLGLAPNYIYPHRSHSFFCCQGPTNAEVYRTALFLTPDRVEVAYYLRAFVAAGTMATQDRSGLFFFMDGTYLVFSYQDMPWFLLNHA